MRGLRRAWREAPAIACCLAALALFAWHVSLFDTFADDAYITYRYAQNLARGLGPVWNPRERVEGYSNFLWMLVLAGAHRIAGHQALPAVARIMSLVCGGSAVVLAFALARRLTQSRFWGLIAALGIAGSSAFAAHARNGLESTAFAMLVLAVAWALGTTSVGWLACALFAVCAIRFDGILVAVIAGCAVLVAGPSTPASRRFFSAAMIWLPPYMVLNAWRLAYYRHLIPNSVAAKEGRSFDTRFVHGITYLRGFFEAERVVLALFLLGGVGIFFYVARRRSRPFAPEQVFLFVMTFAYFVYLVWIGGCWMPAWRMMAHVVPALVVFAVVSFASIVTPLSRIPFTRIAGRSVFALACVAGVYWQIRRVAPQEDNLVKRITYWRDEVLALGEMGAWMHRTLPRDVLVSSFAAGALPYYAEVPCLDPVGLTDEHIARLGHKDANEAAGHVASDWPYVLQRRPDIWVSTRGGGFTSSRNPHSDYRFQGAYDSFVFEFTQTKNPHGRYVTMMLRRDRKDELLQRLKSDPTVTLVE